MSTNINSTEQIVEINAGDQITNVNIVSQSTTQVISGEQVVTVDVNAGTIPAAWGSITGTLSNQTDLQNALNAKQNNITLTTTGTTGVATLVGATLNIPNYVSSTKQTEWDSAYNDKINSAEVSGTTTKTLTLTQQDGGIIQASWSDFDTAPVTSVFGRTGDVVATEGDYNINQLGDVTITSATNGQVLKYNGTAWVNAADASGLTSVGLAMPSAFTVSGSPLTSNGTITVTGAGTTSQYVRGDGSLAAFPSVSNEAKTLIREVYNKTGATLTKGTVIYIDGGQGNLPTVTKALAVGDSTSAQTFGIVQSDITNMNNGFVVVAGGIDNLDTQAYTEGTALYLSPTTAGAWTSTKPYAPQHIVYIGVVVRSHPTQGVIEVKIQNGYELDELHNVSARFPVNKDGLFYNSTSGVWENKSIAGVLGYTPVPESRIITINGTAQNLSADRTWNVGTVTQVAASGGTGISVAGSPVTGSGTITITNTAPDQVVGLTGAGTTSISGTYPNFTITSNDQYTGTVTSVAASGGTGISISGSPVTGSGTISITNTAPDQIVSLTGAGTTTISGTYPNFTVTSNDQYVGTVTSVNATVPTGFEVSGVPITSSGTVDIKFASGYSLPTNAKQSEWDTAYTKRLDSLTVTGNSGSATLTSNVLNVPTYTLTGLGGEPAITAGTTSQYWRGDKSFQTLDTSVVPENGPIYFTEPRVRATVLSGLNITGGSISASDSVLNAFGKVQNQINGLIGGSIFQSTWNASTNTPTLASGVGTKGYYYIVSVAGTTNLDGITDWQIGDWAIFDGTVWRKVDNTDAVVSVNGYTGIVSLVLDDLADVSAASPTNAQLLRFNGTSSKWENWTPNYLTAETDTLQSVTDRGATTTNTINVGIATGTGAGTKGINVRRGRISFSDSYEANHSIYNNYLDIDGEGAWDGMKMNVLNGLRIRTGQASSQVPTQILSLDSTGVTITGKIAKTGGTTSQFLKANGDVDSNTYITGGFIGTTALQSAAAAQSLTGINNINIVWENQYIIMNYDNTYRQGILFNQSDRSLRIFSTGDTGATEGGKIDFYTRAATGTSSTDIGTRRMRLNQAGNLIINPAGTYSESLLTIKGTNATGDQIHIVQENDDRGWRIAAQNNGHWYLRATSTGTNTNRIIVEYDTGNVSLSAYTTNGLLKTSGGTGTIAIATAGTDYVVPSALNSYLPLAGGTMTGQIILKESTDSADYTKGIRFPNDPYGGSSDVSGFRLYRAGASGENQVLELYVGNDGGDDSINFRTGVGGTANNDAVTINGNKIWNSANLTNLNQLTNGPGYITSYTETDTLASVVSRGNTTTSTIKVGDSSLGTTGINIRRGRLCFSNDYEANHSIYNNLVNIDAEGAWDGMKMNVYLGLDVRTGDAGSATPATMLTVRPGGVGINRTGAANAVLDVVYKDASTNIIRVSSGTGSSTYRWRVDQSYSMIMTNAAGADTFSVSTAGAINTPSTVSALRAYFTSNSATDSTTALLANATTNDNTTFAAMFGSLNDGLRMVVRADGRVGVGTTTLNSKFVVYEGDIRLYKTHVINQTATWSQNILFTDEVDRVGAKIVGFRTQWDGAPMALAFETGAVGTTVERMRIGSVATRFDIMIGNTSSPYSADNRGAIFVNGANESLYGWGTGGSAKGYMYHNGTNVYLENSNSGGSFNFTQVGAGNFNFYSNGNTNWLSILSNGDLRMAWSDHDFIMNFDNTYRQGIKFVTADRSMRLFSTGAAGDNASVRIFTRKANGSSSSDIGSERFRVNGDGNTIINPAGGNGIYSEALLTIKASENDGNQIHIVQSNDNRGWRFRAKTDGHFYLQSTHLGNDGDRFKIQYDTGKVSINTTASIGMVTVNNNTFSGANGVNSDGRVGYMLNGALTSYVYASTYNDPTYPDYGFVFIHGANTSSYNVWSISPDGPAKGSSLNFIYGQNAGNIHVGSATLVLKGSTTNVGIGKDPNSSYKLDVNGSVQATSYFESSDMRFKKLLDNKINYKLIANIEAKYYIKEGKEELGYFAQEFQGLFDAAISKREDGYLDLSYRQIHTAKIAALENEIRELKAKLNG